ncbi:MAG TPA: R3H domain-containing nucleic acid-binding protein [Candidatus Saccharimonadales bacterium]|nr:R3H domain-containing nucleic acid-binding protein [Candidatus Saccharimonadales bacterium]
MEEAVVFAKRYLEDMLSFFGLNIDIYASSEDDVIELEVPSSHLNGFLIGQHGDTMRAMQFMVSSALKSKGFDYTRVNVDVAEYKKQRADHLAQKANTWLESVKANGEAMELQPMSAVDRRVIHKLAQEHGLESESVGEGRDRRIVLKPAE